MTRFGGYAGGRLPGIESLDSFYRKQHPDGFISREISEIDGGDIWGPTASEAVNPPLLAASEWRAFEKSGDVSRLSRVLGPLVRHYEWIESHRRWSDGTYWSSGFASGLDNLPRNGLPTSSSSSYGLSWIDLAAQQAEAAEAIAMIANQVGDPDLAQRFLAEHGRIGQIINASMWDNETGMYSDVIVETGAMTSAETIADFWPMVSGVVPPARCRRLAEALEDPKRFSTPHPFPTLSVSDSAFTPTGGYWRGGVWSPTNLMVLDGLWRCGQRELAFLSAMRHVDAIAQVAHNDGTLYENYSPSCACRSDFGQRDFVGWTGVSAIVVLLEYVLGIHLAAPTRSIGLDLRFEEAWSVDGLVLGHGPDAVIVSLKVSSASGGARTVEVSASGKVEIQAEWRGERVAQTLDGGIAILNLESDEMR